MKFYQLTYSTVPEEVGTTHPQSQTSRDLISLDDPRHLRKQKFGFMTDVYMPEPIVHPNAKMSDLLSTVVTWRLIISEKIKCILENYMMPGQCQFLEIIVQHLSTKYKYWVLNPLFFNMELIDFPTSEIWLCGPADTKLKKLAIDSLEAFNEYSQKLQLPDRLNIYNVTLRNKSNIDFIQLKDVPGIKYFVSERLKDEMQKVGCTGISFIQMK